MTTRRRSFVHATAIAGALSCICACEGGQSGDDGQMVEQPRGHSLDGGVTHDGGVMPERDAGQPVFVVPCCFVLDGPSELACAAGTSYVAGANPLVAVLDAPFHCTGGEGLWSCTCDGREIQSFAAGCVGALLEACGKNAEPVGGGDAALPKDCETTLESRAGHCEEASTGSYMCLCAGALESKRQRADTCEAALWTACATGCGDSNSSCAIDRSAQTGSYACDCEQNAGIARAASGATCALALEVGCKIEVESETACNGYSGFCDSVDGTYQCTCVDGSHGSVLRDDAQRWQPCTRAIESVCGTDAPAGKLCERDENGYQARCIQPIDDAAPFNCDCVFHAATSDVVSAVEAVSGMDCDDALVSVCPQVLPVDADARARACDYYAGCHTRYLGFDLDACKLSAPDACVTCTNVELDKPAQDASDCPVAYGSCADACTELVAKPVAVAACEADLDAAFRLTDQGKCLCERCWPAFGECVADAGCTEMLDCAVAQGCEGDACASDPVCGPIIARYQGTHSLAVLLRLDQCPERKACKP